MSAIAHPPFVRRRSRHGAILAGVVGLALPWFICAGVAFADPAGGGAPPAHPAAAYRPQVPQNPPHAFLGPPPPPAPAS